MTQAALQEVRKSRELIAHIMATSPNRGAISPVQYFSGSNGSKLRGLCASPLNDSKLDRVSSPQNYRLTVSDIRSPSQQHHAKSSSIQGRKATESQPAVDPHHLKVAGHRREGSMTSTRLHQTTVTTQGSLVGESTMVDSSSQEVKRGSAANSYSGGRMGVGSPAHEPPSMSGSFETSVKWNQRQNLFSAMPRDSIAEEEGSCTFTPPS